jgi:hypothetical protein
MSLLCCSNSESNRMLWYCNYLCRLYLWEAQLDATVSDLPAGLTSVVSNNDKTVTSGTYRFRAYTITTSGLHLVQPQPFLER